MEHTLKQTVAELFHVPPDHIQADFPLSSKRMQGSLVRARLDAALRHRVGVKCPAVYSVKTYGELAQAVLGEPLKEPNGVNGRGGERREKSGLPVPPPNLQAPQGLRCGIDLEMVENFPVVPDYWQDEFYSTAFTSSEIAYCLVQEEPRMHFAGRWCAKEALKKCQPTYLREDMKNLELVSEPEGQPFFRHYVEGVPSSLPVAVSISHTSLFAVAIVVQAS